MTRLLKSGSLWLALALILAPALPDARAQLSTERSSVAVMRAFKEVVAKPSESTVRVSLDGKDVALGAIVDADGWILTKASLLMRGKLAIRLKSGKSYDAKLVGVEEKNDLAMLKVSATGLKPIEWAPSKSAEPGDWLATPGLGDLPVAIGVVGVETRKLGAREVSFMTPDPKAGFLGVFLEPNKLGPMIRVQDKGPAAKGGLKTGDIIQTVGGTPIPDPETLMSTIQKFKPDDVVPVKVKRGGEMLTLKVTLGRRPSDFFDRSDRMNKMGSDLSARRGGFPTILQHDTVIKPGDCGGPIVDLDGKAVGVNIARAGRTESFAIPSESVLAVLSDLKSGKFAPKEASPEEKISDLEKTRDRLRSQLREAESQLAEDATPEERKRVLRDQIRMLRRQINDIADEIDSLRPDSTRKD